MRNAMLSMLLLAVTPASALADTPAHHPPSPGTLDITSPAFGDQQRIPAEYTCEGSNVSPPLAWSRVPAGTRSIAILVDDPDAPRGTFTHWLVTGLSPAVSSLGKGAALPAGALAAKNDMGNAGYAGPCPPSGRHRYQFRVYALDVELGKAMTRAELLTAIRGHVLATGLLVGTYEKQAGRSQR